MSSKYLDLSAMSSSVTMKPSREVIKADTASSWQMEMLMEKLRRKAYNLRPLTESAKLIKQSILNKQHILDPGEQAALGQCLDKLQQNINVTSLPAMVERLEAIARHLGLTFTSGTSGPEVYISCDMFYVEVHLQNEGKVRDVKVELAGDQNETKGQSSPELVDCLSKGNFTDFTAHLEGFLSIYQLNTEKKNKCKAYQALQALEMDLIKLFEMAQETLGGDTQRLIFKSPVGLLMRRKGGHPVKMIYFNSPYELLDVATQRSVALTYETAATRDMEHYVSVSIEPSTTHKLQTTSLVNIKKGTDGLKLPAISGLSSTNSVSLPACFSLRLKKPMAISLALAQKISEVTGIPCYEASTKQPLLSLIIKQATDIQTDHNNNKGLFVTLPDQQHCYFIASSSEFEGVLVHRVPFTHPTSVAHILEILRVQGMFNSLITSCIRPESKQAMESAFIFEVTAVSHDYLSITFEHPQEESTATAELDLTDFSNVKCKLYTLTQDTSLCSDEYATKVLQRCLSIPITMRAVMRKFVKEEKEILPQGDSVVKMESNTLPSDPNQNTKFLFSDYGNLGMRRDQVVGSHVNNINNVVAKSPSTTQASFGGSSNGDTSPSLLSSIGMTATPAAGATGAFGPALQSLPQKHQFHQHFLADGKMAKVRKRKPGLDSDEKSPKVTEDIVIEVNDKSSESLINEACLHMRRDVKFEKLQNALGKRRSSADNSGLSDAVGCDLAALREKVYGVGSAASFAKLSYMHSGSKASKDDRELSKKFKKQKSEGGSENRKSPIVLDLTDVESSKKCGALVNTSLSSSSSSISSSSVNLSAALLKRPGIEIIPIPGSNTPISIPSSITVTPVIKSSDNKLKDKKEKKDRKDFDRKDKKRRRDDSPNSSFSSSNIANTKSSKIQIISTGNMKNTSITSLESLKGDGKSVSGVMMKPSTSSYQSPIKKPSLSPTLSKTIVQPSKVTFSPSHKSNKLIYSPTHQSSQLTSSSSSTASSASSISPMVSVSPLSSSKLTTSPKQCVSPKHSSVSPKHCSTGKPSMNALKSSSPTFTKPSHSPKLNKGGKEKSSSPARPSSCPIPSVSSSSSSTSPMKSKMSSGEKIKPVFSDALTITKVSSGETISSCSISLTASNSLSSFAQTGQQCVTTASLMDKLLVDKAKSSPPKNRKGSSLSDIVDKLRAAGGSGDSQSKDKSPKAGQDGKKEGDNFTIKSSTGLKFTINKAKHKEGGGNMKSSQGVFLSSNSSSPNSKNSSKSQSGLKPGVVSGPASKKVSVSSLPPIPKLPPASVSSVTATTVSPLANSLPLTHSSPLQYGRDRQRDTKERERDKERLQGSEKGKPKEGDSGPNANVLTDIRKDCQEKSFHKDDQCVLQSGTGTAQKPQTTDAVERSLQDMFGDEDNPDHSSTDESQLTYVSSLSQVDHDETDPIADQIILTSSKDTTVDCGKETSGMMAPPIAPVPPSKHIEKDPLAINEIPQSENVPNLPLPPMLRAPSPSNMHYPPSPSVSIKIVKSPAPVTSPLNMISPQSVTSQHSPCIIDDELMDEALMGSRK